MNRDKPVLEKSIHVQYIFRRTKIDDVVIVIYNPSMDSILVSGIGQLKTDKDVAEWLRSENVAVKIFDGKSLTFVIDIKKDLDSALLNKVELAIQNFLNLDSSYRNEISNLVYENYQDMIDHSDIKHLDVKKPSDIWNFIYPEEIFISQRSRRDEDIYIKVVCNCDWDKEHGLQLVFKNGLKITRVSSQDGHLTNSDAYDTPDSEDKLLSIF